MAVWAGWGGLGLPAGHSQVQVGGVTTLPDLRVKSLLSSSPLPLLLTAHPLSITGPPPPHHLLQASGLLLQPQVPAPPDPATTVPWPPSILSPRGEACAFHRSRAGAVLEVSLGRSKVCTGEKSHLFRANTIKFLDNTLETQHLVLVVRERGVVYSRLGHA